MWAPWTPRSEGETWHHECSVAVDAWTRLEDPDFDGASKPVSQSLDASQLPEDFELAVIYGPSGSGKSSLLEDLVQHYGAERLAPQAFDFCAHKAICSHPGWQGNSIDRLGCVGLNRVPSWLKPWHVLSDGERQRVLCGLSLRTGAVLDDFAGMVDERNAVSMAASLAKFVRSQGFGNVLIGTTKRCVLPFLAPDFVVFAESGVIMANPWPAGQRSISIEISTEINGFQVGPKGGWQGGRVDSAKLCAPIDVGAGPRRLARPVLDAVSQRALTVSVGVCSRRSPCSRTATLRRSVGFGYVRIQFAPQQAVATYSNEKPAASEGDDLMLPRPSGLDACGRVVAFMEQKGHGDRKRVLLLFRK